MNIGVLPISNVIDRLHEPTNQRNTVSDSRCAETI